MALASDLVWTIGYFIVINPSGKGKIGMTAAHPKQFASAFWLALSNTAPIRYLTMSNYTLGMATGLLRQLGRGHEGRERPVPDLGTLVADYSDRDRLITPIQFVLGGIEILEAENPVCFKETFQGTSRTTLSDLSKTHLSLPERFNARI